MLYTLITLTKQHPTMPEQLFSRSRVKSGAIALVPNDSLFKHDCGLVGVLDGSTSIVVCKSSILMIHSSHTSDMMNGVLSMRVDCA